MKQREKWSILGGVLLAMLLSSLDQTIVSTAMPTIVQELKGLEHISWVFTAYMLGATVTVPVYGKLSDLFGRRNLYILGILIFLAGSILCGLAQNMTQLILFRALQGIGGGAMMVNSFAIIGDVFPPAERGKFQGLIGGVFGLSSIAGPLLGGWITDHTSWRWVFYINLPLGAIAIGVLAAALPKIITPVKDRRIDWLGAFFIVATLIPLLLSLVWGGSVYAWRSATILVALSIAVVAFVLFIRIEKRAVNPILSLDLFRNRVFVTSVIALFFTAMGMFGAILYIPLFSQTVIGGSATHAGLILTPLMLALVTASALSGQLISRTGRYKALAITGTAITVAALLFFSGIRADVSNTGLVVRMIGLGIGLGTTMPVYTLAVQSAFPKQRLGEVTAGTQLFRSIGGTVGTAILGGIMNSQLAVRSAAMAQQPFVQYWRQLRPSETDDLFSGNLLQTILAPEQQEYIRRVIKQLPPTQMGAVQQQYQQFILAAKGAYSQAVDQVFLVAAALMGIALIAVCFLPEIALRTSNEPVLEETGELLEDELGQTDKAHRADPNPGPVKMKEV